LMIGRQALFHLSHAPIPFYHYDHYFMMEWSERRVATRKFKVMWLQTKINRLSVFTRLITEC
jgi:hypothetical protein